MEEFTEYLLSRRCYFIPLICC